MAALSFHYMQAGCWQDAPSNKLNIACVGIGGMGAANLQACKSENIAALCDVDSEYSAKIFARYPEAKVYKDYASCSKGKGH